MSTNRGSSSTTRKGGMTQFIIRMMRIALANNLRKWNSEPVSSISTLPDGSFKVITKSFVIRAPRVICSIDPTGFPGVSGNVADLIQAAPEFQAILPVQVATVAAWWNERWWEKSAYHNRSASRAISQENCFNKMELIPVPYAVNQNGMRAVYDDGLCVDMWREIVTDPSKADMLQRVVVDRLQSFWDDVRVPQPRTLKGREFRSTFVVQ